MRSLHGRAFFTEPAELNSALGVDFSDEQLAAATAPLEPGVIIAGAGSGKTTVMAARVVWLVGRGLVRPDQVLGLTFTRKAAAELSARIRKALLTAGITDAGSWPEQGEQVVMTYDAFAARLVAEHGLRLGVESDQVMLTGAGRFRLASRVVSAAAGPFEHLSRLRPDTVTERVLALDSEMQNHLVSDDDLDRETRRFTDRLGQAPLYRGNPYKAVVEAQRFAAERLELASLTRAYQRLKLDLGLVEFADQMAVAARLACSVPAVADLVRREFRVVLLDEYQDTSAAQAALLRGLFSGRDPAHGRGHPVTAVGDPFQAIYGWRGAAASNIVEFSTDFPGTDDRPALAFPLTVNRRSGPQILAAANDVAEPLRADPLVAMDLSEARLVAGAGAAPAEVWAGGFATWPDEVEWICDRIVDLHTGPRAMPWREIAVLSRRNADLGDLFAGLRRRDVPVEIVGLGGLLSLPEVMDVVATLRLVDDPTANPALVRLLTGPRWRIGPPDLAALGARAMELAGRRPAAAEASLRGDLEAAVYAVDPTEVVSLSEAAADPGPGPYSVAARTRFAAFASELAELRRHADEPVLDLARRVIATLQLDVEAALQAGGATPWGSQLRRFLDAVGDYADVDGESSLGGLLGYLDAERDQGVGLDLDVPRSSDAVQLLTIHKAKGLEWDAVFLPDLAAKVFPSERTTANWLRNSATLPPALRGDRRSIPQLREATKTGMDAYAAELKDDHLRSEDRLAYVGFTRARRVVAGTVHNWRGGLSTVRRPSAYYELLRRHAEESGRVWCDVPPAGDENPLEPTSLEVGWPAALDETAFARRTGAAQLVVEARDTRAATGAYPPDDLALLDDAARVAEWDTDLELLLAETRRLAGAREVRMPGSVSVSGLMAAHRDPGAFARALARPMPRQPSRAAAFGTRFHEWVQRQFGQTSLPVTADDEATAGDVRDEAEFRELCDAFVAGRFGARAPIALEAPFTLAIGGITLRGRIDAVYDGERPGTYVVIDWKTGESERADPLQLACYRVAWAELNGIPASDVAAGFHFVRSDRLVMPPLPGRAELEVLIGTVGEG
ncbi:ATP-dependent DNA helicase [Propionicicella superfundia]|uniref:ATP-dependent DNA helicase n=1 Tax=Propionicicella superfundia TaxID=348582 RepID=UPI00040E485C|nr:ATP-dependent DNA helicase [Propionicicella superfundia]